MRARILVADDDPTILDFLTMALEADYAVLGATDGATALALAEGERPDLILTDVLMPRLSGLEVARRLRARSGDYQPPIVLISALRPAPLPPRTTFLAKPFTVHSLTTKVSELLREAT